jgi:hypothetical protein
LIGIIAVLIALLLPALEAPTPPLAVPENAISHRLAQTRP